MFTHGSGCQDNKIYSKASDCTEPIYKKKMLRIAARSIGREKLVQMGKHCLSSSNTNNAACTTPALFCCVVNKHSTASLNQATWQVFDNKSIWINKAFRLHTNFQQAPNNGGVWHFQAPFHRTDERKTSNERILMQQSHQEVCVAQFLSTNVSCAGDD